MFVLLKHSDKKGILVITHKEYNTLNHFLHEMSHTYYILLHVGFNVNILIDKYIQFYLLPDSRCSNKNHIPYTTRSFTPSVFLEKSSNKNRQYDFIYVGRCVEIKNTINVLKAFNNTNKKCIMIILDQNNKDPYYRKFKSMIPSPNVTIIDTHNLDSSGPFRGMTHDQLSDYYTNSKVYVHACANEGESRSIHEAFCSGCVIMSLKNMKGGGNDFYNSNNYVLYELHNINTSMECALSKYFELKYIPEKYKRLCETYTIPTFLNILTSSLDNLSTDGWDTKNLNFKLAGHYYNVPWYIKGKLTADILTMEQYKIFKNSIGL